MGIGMLQQAVNKVSFNLFRRQLPLLQMQIRQKNKIICMYLQFCNPLEPDPLAHGTNYEQLLCPHGQQVRPFPLQQLCPSLTPYLSLSLSPHLPCNLPNVKCNDNLRSLVARMRSRCHKECTYNNAFPFCNTEFRVSSWQLYPVGSECL